jgi:ubiquinone/menaquinone biosynthesis C-methylase UbiE
LRCMTAERFDAQAPGFDDRAGVPEDAAGAVAQAVLDLIAPGRDDVLVELGAGTGEIGRHLARSVNYLGLDRSGGMLDAFRAKIAAAPAGGPRLVRADASQGWPVQDGSVKAVFASRVVHLLDCDHVRSELERVCAPGGYFLVGYVSRDEVSVKHLLREKRESLLRERGLIPRSRRAGTRRLLDRLVALGASSIESRSVVTWSAQASAKQVVDAWRRLQSMGGTELESPARAGILAELMEWAGRELGDPDTVRVWQERYILGGVRLREGTSTAHC